MFFGGFFFLLVIAGIVAAVVWGGFGNHSFAERYGLTPNRENPFEILQRRYARGEISHDEFERMKHDLG